MLESLQLLNRIMKAALIYRYGPPEVFQYADTSLPRLRPQQLLVKVHASSVNPIDWKIRQGRLKLLTGNRFPLILGYDVAGEVVEVGKQVTQFQVGDRIYAQLDQFTGGAYAEYAAVNQKVAALKPKSLPYEQAAAVPLAASTALQALRDQGQLKPGQRVLINGASGGVGLFAVQLAKILGAAEVVGVCSSKNAALVSRLGADHVIDYKQQDFTRDDALYDLVFDVVGNRSFADCKHVLQRQGCYITTQPYPANVAQSLVSSLLPGATYKVIVVRPNGADLHFLGQQIEAKRLQVVIDRTYRLADIAAAHAYCEAERTVGKVVITIP